MTTSKKPNLAVVLGDPAGIGPELIAKLLADPSNGEKAGLLVIGDKEVFEQGLRIAGCTVDYEQATSFEEADLACGKPVLVDFRGATEGAFERSVSTVKGGRYCLDTLRMALDATLGGYTDGVLFAPLNKNSMHQAGMHTNDEMHWFVEQLGFDGPICEFNVMDGLWTSRVTSHVAHREVADLITQERVIEAIRLVDTELRRTGVAAPRIAVCGLNPHNGDNGSFGREEIDIIAPAIATAVAQGLPVEGPFPADTVFLKVQGDRREYDAIVTMYHDQGQIAMKLMGFSRGITVQGGLPIPILTPAHGTAFDIAGQGVANVSATQQAFELACRMATERMNRAVAA